MYNLEWIPFHAKYLYKLNLCLDMYVYFNFDKSYIYLEGFLVLMIFMFLVRNFIFKLNCLFPWLCLSHKICTLTLLDVFSWFYFHEYYMCYIEFECHWLSDFHVSWISSCFIPYLKDFVLVYKFIIKLVVYSSRGRAFKFV